VSRRFSNVPTTRQRVKLVLAELFFQVLGFVIFAVAMLLTAIAVGGFLSLLFFR
jgi:uncharacterized membrane protein (DUF106 family)